MTHYNERYYLPVGAARA